MLMSTILRSGLSRCLAQSKGGLGGTSSRVSSLTSYRGQNKGWLSSSFQSMSTAPTSTNEGTPEEFVEEGDETEGEWMGCTRKFLAPISTTSRGADILNNPLFNKGTAFKGGERDRLRIRGLLPPRRANMKIQKERILKEIRGEPSMIRKNIILEDLHDRNETIYHRLLVDHMEEMAPIIYTPTVGQACKEFGMRYRRPRGMYFCEVSLSKSA